MNQKEWEEQYPLKINVFKVLAGWDQALNLNLNAHTLANWMDKVGTTSKSDVKQKEKKP